MPILGMVGAPQFNGKDVSEFIKVAENLFCRYAISETKDKVAFLVDYCTPAVTSWATQLPEFVLDDYEGLVKRMKEEYAKNDRLQQMVNTRWLEAYKQVVQTERDDLAEYIRIFHFVSEQLCRKQQLTRYMQGI